MPFVYSLGGVGLSVAIDAGIGQGRSEIPGRDGQMHDAQRRGVEPKLQD